MPTQAGVVSRCLGQNLDGKIGPVELGKWEWYRVRSDSAPLQRPDQADIARVWPDM